MARSFVSPGVFTREIDVSFLGPGVGAIGAAMIGLAPQGPAFVPTTVQTFNDFVSTFGNLNQNDLLGYQARSYLQNGSNANIVRVLGPAGRLANGVAVNPGYTAQSMWAVTALTGTTGVVSALIDSTGSLQWFVTDLPNDLFFLSASGTPAFTALTASMLSASTQYIRKMLNTDPTQLSTLGYWLRDTYDYTVPLAVNGNFTFGSASLALTNFAVGYASASSPWIKSQVFGAATEYNLFKVHTLGHGNFENGRFKVSLQNVKPSVNPNATQYGTFDLVVRAFSDTDDIPIVVEQFLGLTFDSTSPQYILNVIGDSYWLYNNTLNKMQRIGVYSNGSKYIRLEVNLSNGKPNFPQQAVPWGFRGLVKPTFQVSGAVNTNGFYDLPLVQNLLDKQTQTVTDDNVYWGMELSVSGSVNARLDFLPGLGQADADFSLKLVSGSADFNLAYNTANPAASQKSPALTSIGTTSTTLDPTLARFTVPLAFGFDGFDRQFANPIDNATQLTSISTIGVQALRQGIDIVSDPDFIDINMLLVPGVWQTVVTTYGANAMQNRGDAFYPQDIQGTTVSTAIQTVQNMNVDNNYTACYYPSVIVQDDVNGGTITLPASIAAAAAIAYNDRVSYPWFAPAGLNRAGLTPTVMSFNVLGVADYLTLEDRNQLYENRINPIARFPDQPQGVIWGQKTLQLKHSALDRINVRRLLIRAKKLIASTVRFLVFEQANATTMTRFKQLVNPILADIQQKQGLQKFLVVMDDTNNPPALLDQNTLKGQIFLVPTKSAEFIGIDFVVSPQGASFGE